jgi:CheY-like chemotaxis protein
VKEKHLSKRELSNREVLVVEDEMMIAMLIEDMLDEFGCQLVGPATNVPRALDLIGKENVEIAVLDLNLDGQDTYAIADALRQKMCPSYLRPDTAPPARVRNMETGRSCRNLSRRGTSKMRSRKLWQVRLCRNLIVSRYRATAFSA